jgi:phage terminase large subunit-like protein
MVKEYNPDKAKRLLDTLEAAAARRKNRRIDFFTPYPKQQEFFDLGSSKRERLLIAGNQLGKSEAGAAEVVYHLTGEYPDWWLGRRWDRAVKGWAAGETGLVVRDVQQKKLCGEPGVVDSLGTGMIPKSSFTDKPTLARGVTDAFDSIQVRHKSGGISILRFKSYEQGRAKFQGDTLDFVWCDEEPDLEIYSECLTRVTATKGMVFITFTPLKGKSDVVNRFLSQPSPDRGHVTMTIYDALHILPEERQTIIDGYPAHERDARVNGIPILGGGRIFPYEESLIAEDALTYVPAHWVKMWGIDFGIDHPFAAVLGLWDKDNDVIHIHYALRMTGENNNLPVNHAAAMKPVAVNVPVAWPQDGTQRDKGSGEVLAQSYKKAGLRMLPEPAMWEEGGNSTEAGILEMQQRFTTGRLKVARHLAEWWEEFRLYHRKDGQIVKVHDDLLSATRVFVMAKRHAKVATLGGTKASKKPGTEIARDVDFDLS